MKPRTFVRQFLLPLLSTSAFFVQCNSINAAELASPSLLCSDTYFPVALAPGEPTIYKVYGQLCGQSSLIDQTVQVLVHGGTYDHNYWDFPSSSEEYSYVKALTNAGYATFAIDRIGIGKSDHPPAEQVTINSNAYVLHQVIEGLRDGQIGTVPVQRIEIVGHSVGSITAVAEASQYGDVDGLILTGFLHNIPPDLITTVSRDFYPVQLDPRLSEKNLPEGYLTTIPGTRSELFYNPSTTDPQIIAKDEASKETITTGELNTLFNEILSNASKQIQVPVLEVVGQNDRIFCSGIICDNAANVATAEAPYFSPEARLQTFVLPDAGHNVNLHFNALDWYDVARQWSDSFIGVSTTESNSIPESSNNFGFLILSILGAVSLFKANANSCSNEKLDSFYYNRNNK